MRILIVCQYFWPENFKINDIALGLKEQGHEVIVFTGKPNYPAGNFFKGYSMFGVPKETWQGITIYRSALIPRGSGSGLRLMLNYLSFVFFSCWKALFTRIEADAILVYQLSPVTMAFPAMVFRKKTKAPMFLYVQDLWPHSVIALNAIRNRFIIRLLTLVTQWIYKSSDRILIQSRAFSNYLVANKVDQEKLVYLPNSCEDFYKKVDQDPAFAKYFTGEINLVFAGNIGQAQSFDTLIEAADLVKKQDSSVHWVIIGAGRKKADLEKEVSDRGLDDVFRFIGSFESIMMPAFFAYADAMIMSLQPDPVLSLTIPSKLQTYMACAKPVIGSIDGEGSVIIVEAACGLTAPAGDALKLAEIVLTFKRMTTTEKKKLGDNSINYFTREFSREKLLEELVQVMRTR